MTGKEDGLERMARDVLGRLESGLETTAVRYVGDYLVEEEIARGGMGVVYRARQASLDRPVALKMILSGRFASTEEVARFRVEAEAAAALSHPGIVAIHETGVHEGHHYFSMDYVEGRSLERFAGGAPIAGRRAAEYALAIAEAVQYAHERGVLHRDLKPSNILLDREGRVRITDFGLAKRFEGEGDLTGTGQILGTPGYMAPEQAEGRAAAPAADVYSIGAILYELVTGRAPFVAESPLATLIQLRDTEPVPPRVLNPRLARDLETICLAAIEKSPDRRYASARHLAADLRRYLDHAPIEARPASRLRRIAHWAERHPWQIAGIIAFVAVALAGVIYGLVVHVRLLQWRIDYPDVEPPSLPSAEIVDGGLWGVLFMALLWIPWDLRRRSGGLTARQARDQRVPRVRGIAPIPAPVLWVYGAILAASLVVSVEDLRHQIERFVRDGGASLWDLFFTGWIAWLAAGVAIQLAMEVRAKLLGIPPRIYSTDESDAHVDLLSVRIEQVVASGELTEAGGLCSLLRSVAPQRPEWMEMQALVTAAQGDHARAAGLYRSAAAQADRLGGYSDGYLAELEDRAEQHGSEGDGTLE